MARINELYFNLYQCEYRLTFYKNENPKLFKNGIEFQGNKSEVLRNYIVELGFGNTLFKKQTTQQLSIFILNHFSDKPIKDKDQTKTISNKKSQIKIETPKIKINQDKLHLSENFKVVMICSGKKNDSTFDEHPNIKFKAVTNNTNEFHPDDFIPKSDIKWRKYLQDHQNDQNLLRAYELYKRKEYRILQKKFKKSLYILSAGWGIVNSDFKLPNYDITFSNSSDPKTKRKKSDLKTYQDFNQMILQRNEDIVFIGSVDYLPQFYNLTQHLTNRKIIFYFGKEEPKPKPTINIETYQYRKFHSSDNRSWYYELANNIANGIIL